MNNKIVYCKGTYNGVTPPLRERLKNGLREWLLGINISPDWREIVGSVIDAAIKTNTTAQECELPVEFRLLVQNPKTHFNLKEGKIIIESEDMVKIDHWICEVNKYKKTVFVDMHSSNISKNLLVLQYTYKRGTLALNKIICMGPLGTATASRHNKWRGNPLFRE